MILFYAAENSRVVDTLKELLASFKVKQCRSISTMAKCLRKPCHGLKIGLLVISTPEEMVQIGKLQNLFRDLKLLLVLPGRDSEMVARAHQWTPRFIAYADNGYEQIGAVLNKMMGAKPGKQVGPVLSTVQP